MARVIETQELMFKKLHCIDGCSWGKHNQGNAENELVEQYRDMNVKIDTILQMLQNSFDHAKDFTTGATNQATPFLTWCGPRLCQETLSVPRLLEPESEMSPSKIIADVELESIGGVPTIKPSSILAPIFDIAADDSDDSDEEEEEEDEEKGGQHKDDDDEQQGTQHAVQLEADGMDKIEAETTEEAAGAAAAAKEKDKQDAPAKPSSAEPESFDVEAAMKLFQKLPQSSLDLLLNK